MILILLDSLLNIDSSGCQIRMF